MIIIKSEPTLRKNANSENLNRVEGFVDDSSDLPDASEMNLDEGSIMYATQDAKFYVLDSAGDWYASDGSGEV